MKLTSLTFNEHQGMDTEWFVDGVTLGAVNLIVGKNSTGKSRTLNVIHFLSTILSGERTEIYGKGQCDAVFEHDGETWNYLIEFDNSMVTREELFVNEENLLHRGQGGMGQIFANDIENARVRIKFKVSERQVAVFAKRDELQHPFLTPLHNWATSLRYFKFGTEMSQGNLAIKLNQAVPVEVNEKETNSLVPIYNKARRELGEAYDSAIISDMKVLGYELEQVEIRRPQHLVANVILPGELVGLSVREKPLRCFVDQPSISQGMFRALSLLAQVNYNVMAKREACILVDDIGDGLDFERSCELIDILRAKAESSNLQLILTTNNRFIMNRVPLEEWCLLQRNGHHVTAKNYSNSKNAFERFKITGLSNFDLLTTDFLQTVAPNG